MRDIICEALYYYGMYPPRTNTFRIMFRMKDDVNGRLLQLAAMEALKRYPYYAVRCVSDGREYLLEPNNELFAVCRTSDPLPLGGAESNGYLLAVTYWEDRIWLNCFHGLTDGTGAMNFGRTLLYYYCQKMYDPDLPADGIRTNDGPIPTEERENPYQKIMSGERQLPDEKDILIQVKPDTFRQSLSLFDDPRITQTSPRYFDLRISEQQLMQYCRAQDGTPGIVLSLLMSRAIDRLNPDSDSPIVAGMTMNLRPALEAPLYKGSPLGLACLPYSGRIKQKPFDVQATICRGRLLLAADNERLQAGIKASTQLYRAIDGQPTLEKKKEFVQQVLARYHGSTTFNLSYVGPAHLAATEPYVKELQLQNDSPGLTIEVMAAHGSFFLEIVQDWKEDLYITAFCEELTAQGISFELLSHGEHHVPPILLP